MFRTIHEGRYLHEIREHNRQLWLADQRTKAFWDRLVAAVQKVLGQDADHPGDRQAPAS